MAPPTTIAFVPREQFSTTRQSLETLYQRTEGPFRLVCVDGGSPPEVRRYLEQAARELDFTLLRADGYLTPNQARNLAMPYVTTRYVVFVDNDVLVAPGWLDPLVRCAEETGAWVVGPLCFEFLPECSRIHMAGGECRIEESGAGRRDFIERHHLAHQRLADVTLRLERRETELVEFHTVLVRKAVFRQLGPLDEGLLCNAEHADLCLSVRQAGGHIFLEPRSRITYAPPRKLTRTDLDFYRLRWSEAWCEASNLRLRTKWRLASDARGLAISKHWVAQHRRHALRHLALIRRALGRNLADRLERRMIAPLEAMVNRLRFPPAIFGKHAKPNCRMVYQAEFDPLADGAAAAQ